MSKKREAVHYGTGAVLRPPYLFYLLYFAPSFYEVLPFCVTSEILKGSYFL